MGWWWLVWAIILIVSLIWAQTGGNQASVEVATSLYVFVLFVCGPALAVYSCGGTLLWALLTGGGIWLLIYLFVVLPGNKEREAEERRRQQWEKEAPARRRAELAENQRKAELAEERRQAWESMTPAQRETIRELRALRKAVDDQSIMIEENEISEYYERRYGR